MRRRSAAALAGAALLALGCEASVSTQLLATSPTAATIQIEVAFVGDAAEALIDAPALQAQLAELFTERGLEAERDFSARRVAYTSSLTYDELAAASSISGVGDITLDPHDDGTATLSVAVVTPSSLRDAIIDGVEDEPDADALVAALTGSTIIEVDVVFPGGIEHVDATSGLVIVGDDTTASLEQPLSEFIPGAFAVTGTPGTPRTNPWLIAAGALVVTTAALAADQRRRRR